MVLYLKKLTFWWNSYYFWSITSSSSSWWTTVAVTWVSLSSNSLAFNGLGQTSQLAATIIPSNATNTNVTWSSSNTSVATVSSSWLVTTVAGWNATITVTTSDGWHTATCAVTVSVGCFLKWTPILTKDWNKNIEDIVEWDIVMSFDEDKWEIVYNKVIDFIKHPYEWSIIKLNWWLLEATYNHPVYTSKDKENREYKFIWEIEEWDWIYTKWGYVEVTEKEEWYYNWDVYNFTVENNHNYFVWDWILVHNATTWWG